MKVKNFPRICKQKVDKIVKPLNAILALGLCCFLLWHLIRQMDSNVLGAIVAAMGAWFVSGSQRRADSKRERERELREKKIPIYDEVLGGFFEIVFRDKTKGPKGNEELGRILRRPLPQFIAWASDEVALSFSRLREISVTSMDKPALIAFAYADFILNVRRDLGHNNTNLGHVEVLQMFVNEPLSALGIKVDQRKLGEVTNGSCEEHQPWCTPTIRQLLLRSWCAQTLMHPNYSWGPAASKLLGVSWGAANWYNCRWLGFTPEKGVFKQQGI